MEQAAKEKQRASEVREYEDDTQALAGRHVTRASELCIRGPRRTYRVAAAICAASISVKCVSLRRKEHMMAYIPVAQKHPLAANR